MIGLGEMKEDEISIFSPPFPLLPMFQRGKDRVKYSKNNHISLAKFFRLF